MAKADPYARFVFLIPYWFIPGVLAGVVIEEVLRWVHNAHSRASQP